jgi:hypothetical protein
MFEDTGQGIREDFARQIFDYLCEYLWVEPSISIYGPGEDANGHENDFREALGLEPMLPQIDSSWRAKIRVPPHRFADASKIEPKLYSQTEAPPVADDNIVMEVPETVVIAQFDFMAHDLRVEARSLYVMTALLYEQGVALRKTRP